jgi:hypothetical protein
MRGLCNARSIADYAGTHSTTSDYRIMSCEVAVANFKYCRPSAGGKARDIQCPSQDLKQ